MSLYSYLDGNFSSDLTKLIESYEKFAGIDAFFNNSQDPKFFYEWAIQGMAYQLLLDQTGGKTNKYLLLLEQPYTATNAQLRTDIMIVEIDTDLITGIEIKSDFNGQSVLSDMNKIIGQVQKGTIARGCMVFLGEDARQLQEFERIYLSDKGVKNALHMKTLVAVPVLASRE